MRLVSFVPDQRHKAFVARCCLLPCLSAMPMSVVKALKPGLKVGDSGAWKYTSALLV